jgi:acyl dehydratase
MRFLKPMYVEEIYKGVVVLEEVNSEKHRGKFSTKVYDQKGELTLEGEALLYHREKF